VSPRKPLLEYGIDGANSDDIDASPMGRFVPCSHGQTARLKNNVLHSLCPEVKHVVPNDLFETNLLTEILVYTMDAADARKKIEDANPFCGKKPSL
jgi:hypothetical protein